MENTINSLNKNLESRCWSEDAAAKPDKATLNYRYQVPVLSYRPGMTTLSLKLAYLLLALFALSVNGFAMRSNRNLRTTLQRSRGGSIISSPLNTSISPNWKAWCTIVPSEDQREQVHGCLSHCQQIYFGFKNNALTAHEPHIANKWIAAAFGMFAFIVSGVPPVLSMLVHTAAIPGVVYGAYLIGASIWSLKEHNSPYATPSVNNKLITDGPFAQVRHPMYGGLILCSMSLAILSRSVEKLLLGSAIAYALVGTQIKLSPMSSTDKCLRIIEHCCRQGGGATSHNPPCGKDFVKWGGGSSQLTLLFTLLYPLNRSTCSTQPAGSVSFPTSCELAYVLLCSYYCSHDESKPYQPATTC
jgi:protein-S-isoprenylcysteine O-methyltransferase Ste14